jgi:hypothetical protein
MMIIIVTAVETSNLTRSLAVRESPASKDVNTEAEETTALGD